MTHKNTSDHLLSQVPDHIVQSYPRFFDFLTAYYEWLEREDNPYHHIKNHMEYMDFQKSLDEYIEFMKAEYLNDIPEDVMLDKELFIKWSRSFNLIRGSRASYKFLFRLLFNEQDTTIYLPKENILRLSDGQWVSGQSKMLVTNSGNQSQFQYQRILQERQVYEDIYEYAYATVQEVRTRYAGRYNLTELSVSDIQGEFQAGYPIETESGDKEWLIPTTNQVQVDDPGINYQVGERVVFDNDPILNIERAQDVLSNTFDTRVSTFFLRDDLEVSINGTTVTDFDYDGRYITEDGINRGDVVRVSMPGYPGYMTVNNVDDEGGITDINVLDLPIGVTQTQKAIAEGIGRNFKGTIMPGLLKSVDGFYENNRGKLSSNMYLQDSYYYQEYSYAIKTHQDFNAYADIVKRLLHPAGFVMFGQISIFETIELMLNIQEVVEGTGGDSTVTIPKYGLGGNFSFMAKNKGSLQRSLYRAIHWNDINVEYLTGEDGYDLQDMHLTRNPSYPYEELRGWMTKDNRTDQYFLQKQEYVEDRPEDHTGMVYVDPQFVSDRV